LAIHNIKLKTSHACHFTQRQFRMDMNNKYCGRHRRRRVHFSTAVDDIRYLTDVVPSSMMEKKEKESTWYSDGDMINMRAGAKALAKRLRTTAGSSRFVTSRPPLFDGDGARLCEGNLKRKLGCVPDYPVANEDDDGRGLEILIFQGRRFKKYIAARTIMECQRKNRLNIAFAIEYSNPNIRLMTEAASLKLGYVSTKCSQWARDVALMTGYLDFRDVYEKNETPLPMSFEQLYQLPIKRKRTNVTASSAGEIAISSTGYLDFKEVCGKSETRLPISYIEQQYQPSLERIRPHAIMLSRGD